MRTLNPTRLVRTRDENQGTHRRGGEGETPVTMTMTLPRRSLTVNQSSHKLSELERKNDD